MIGKAFPKIGIACYFRRSPIKRLVVIGGAAVDAESRGSGNWLIRLVDRLHKSQSRPEFAVSIKNDASGAVHLPASCHDILNRLTHDKNMPTVH